MKNRSIFLLGVLLAAATMAGCSSTGALTATALAGGAAIVDNVLSPGQADPDNQAYLDACVKQFDAEQKASEATTTALSEAFKTAGSDPATRGGLLMLMAVKTMKQEPFRCSLERRRGFVETFTGDGLIDASLRLYNINREDKRAKRALEASTRQFEAQLEADSSARKDMNQFWGDLIGTKPDAGYTSRREADADFINSTTPAPTTAP